MTKGWHTHWTVPHIISSYTALPICRKVEGGGSGGNTSISRSLLSRLYATVDNPPPSMRRFLFFLLIFLPSCRSGAQVSRNNTPKTNAGRRTGGGGRRLMQADRVLQRSSASSAGNNTQVCGNGIHKIPPVLKRGPGEIHSPPPPADRAHVARLPPATQSGSIYGNELWRKVSGKR